MTDEQIALARRAVACRGWWWMPGMRTTDAMRVVHDETAFPGRPCAIREGGWVDTSPPRPLGAAIPDLTDPATLGCLLALVRKAWAYPSAQVAPMFTVGAGWLTYTNDDGDRDHRFYGISEAEALVAALEAAP